MRSQRLNNILLSQACMLVVFLLVAFLSRLKASWPRNAHTMMLLLTLTHFPTPRPPHPHSFTPYTRPLPPRVSLEQ